MVEYWSTTKSKRTAFLANIDILSNNSCARLPNISRTTATDYSKTIQSESHTGHFSTSTGGISFSKESVSFDFGVFAKEPSSDARNDGIGPRVYCNTSCVFNDLDCAITASLPNSFLPATRISSFPFTLKFVFLFKRLNVLRLFFGNGSKNSTMPVTILFLMNSLAQSSPICGLPRDHL